MLNKFSNINLEVIDINTNATPDIFINQGNITFSKRVLDDLNYASNVQYCTDITNKVFAVRVCKSKDNKAATFSKSKEEQTTTLSVGNKNLHEIISKMIPEYDSKKRYKVTGEFDSENRVIYFDMATAEEACYRKSE